MESKRLASFSAPAQTLKPGERELELGPGEHRFRFHHKNSKATRYVFHLRDATTRLSLSGLIEATEKATPEVETLIIHHVPQSEAETIIKTLSRDEASPRYKGMIRIEPGAYGSVSYLNHHSLLIGRSAKSWTTPSLEILNNDVHCSHAATIRTLTPEDLFYLQTRGLPAVEAEQLLIETFLTHA